MLESNLESALCHHSLRIYGNKTGRPQRVLAQMSNFLRDCIVLDDILSCTFSTYHCNEKEEHLMTVLSKSVNEKIHKGPRVLALKKSGIVLCDHLPLKDSFLTDIVTTAGLCISFQGQGRIQVVWSSSTALIRFAIDRDN
jgi:hypothetical protein